MAGWTDYIILVIDPQGPDAIEHDVTESSLQTLMPICQDVEADSLDILIIFSMGI